MRTLHLFTSMPHPGISTRLTEVLTRLTEDLTRLTEDLTRLPYRGLRLPYRGLDAPHWRVQKPGPYLVLPHSCTEESAPRRHGRAIPCSSSTVVSQLVSVHTLFRCLVSTPRNTNSSKATDCRGHHVVVRDNKADARLLV